MKYIKMVKHAEIVLLNFVVKVQDILFLTMVIFYIFIMLI